MLHWGIEPGWEGGAPANCWTGFLLSKPATGLASMEILSVRDSMHVKHQTQPRLNQLRSASVAFYATVLGSVAVPPHTSAQQLLHVWCVGQHGQPDAGPLPRNGQFFLPGSGRSWGDFLFFLKALCRGAEPSWWCFNHFSYRKTPGYQISWKLISMSQEYISSVSCGD